MVKPQFWSFREYGVTSLWQSLPGSLWQEVVLPVGVPSMDQIDLFKI